MFEQGVISVGLFTIGNFVYQAFAGQNWGVALERSFFQAVAILFFAHIISHKI